MSARIRATRSLAMLAADMGLSDEDTAIALMAAALEVLTVTVGADQAFEAASCVLVAAHADWVAGHAN